MSLGSMIPGWGPDPLGSLKEWGIAIVGKGGGGKALVATLNRPDTFTTLSGTTVGGSNAIGGGLLDGLLHGLAKLGTVSMVAATGTDVVMHAGCLGAGPTANGTLTPLDTNTVGYHPQYLLRSYERIPLWMVFGCHHRCAWNCRACFVRVEFPNKTRRDNRDHTFYCAGPARDSNWIWVHQALKGVLSGRLWRVYIRKQQ